MVALPQSEYPALADFVEAIRKRSRALSHKVAVIQCERVVEIKDGEEHERIEFRLAARSAKGLQLRCWLWDDRWCWFDARRGAKEGWDFTWFYDGRVAPGRTGAELVAAVERAHQCFWGDKPDEGALNAIWSPLLLRGPR